MKWISVKDDMPALCVDVLFTDGHKVYYGWQENCWPEEKASWIAYDFSQHSHIENVEHVTHWMEKPKPLKEHKKFPGIEINRERKNGVD